MAVGAAVRLVGAEEGVVVGRALGLTVYVTPHCKCPPLFHVYAAPPNEGLAVGFEVVGCDVGRSEGADEGLGVSGVRPPHCV